MSNCSFLGLPTPRSMWVPGMVKAASHGERCSLTSPSWSSSVHLFFFSIGIEWTLETFMLWCYLSSWLLNHDLCHLLPVLSTLQVSFLIPTTCYNGYRRIILPPRRTNMCLLGCTTDLFVRYSSCRRTVKAVKGALMVMMIVITVSKILFQKRPTTN